MYLLYLQYYILTNFKDHPSVPSLPPAAASRTPEGTLIVRITTPQGSGATEQSSLRTIQSTDSVISQRDLGQGFDRLADEVRAYDHTRGLEHRDLVDHVRLLRDEFHGLVEYLRRTPSPATAVTPLAVYRTPPPRTVSSGPPPEIPPRIQLTDRPVWDNTVLSLIFPRIVEVDVPPPVASLHRS